LVHVYIASAVGHLQVTPRGFGIVLEVSEEHALPSFMGIRIE
jgi:hypothetical protein